VGSDRIIEVELGRSGRGYLDPGYQRVSLPFGMSHLWQTCYRPPMYVMGADDIQGVFMDAFIFDLVPSTTPLSELPTAYLAQSSLLNDIPELIQAVPELPHFKAGVKGEVWRRTLWVGPGGSFTPFHRDPYVGIYSQGKSIPFYPSFTGLQRVAPEIDAGGHISQEMIVLSGG
jgi:hypothetical protein